MIRAYHFVGAKLRDGRPIPADGEWLEHDGDLELCASGLHASVHPFDALQYAPGNTLCVVDCDGEMLEQGDKLVCRRRRIVARIDAEPLLREFARWCALQVIEHWDAPDVVRRYLESGDESLRDAVWDAVRDAAWAAARDAAWDAVRDAAWAAARDAAWAAARDAVWDAVRDAVWDAVRDAVRAAARDAARGAERDAAWAAARDAQRARFLHMVEAAFKGKV